MDDTTKFRESVLDAYRKLAAQHEKTGELLATFRALLDASPSATDDTKRLTAFWAEAWKRKYHEAYQFRRPADFSQLKRLAKTMGVDQVERKICRYMASADPFYVKARHTVGVFVVAINSLGDTAEDMPTLAAAVGCRHTPRCASDADCTTLKLRETDYSR